MKILSIGNSFSQDAQRYLSRVAKSEGIDMNTFNLYIGGCSLATHFQNMHSEDRAYELQMNGESRDRMFRGRARMGTFTRFLKDYRL